MKTFKFPWKCRIMCALGADVPIELARLSRPITDKDFNHHTRGFDSAWDIWVERCTPRTHLVGDRPIPSVRGPGPDRVKFTPAENRALESAGVAPAYMVEPAKAPV